MAERAAEASLALPLVCPQVKWNCTGKRWKLSTRSPNGKGESAYSFSGLFLVMKTRTPLAYALGPRFSLLFFRLHFSLWQVCARVGNSGK